MASGFVDDVARRYTSPGTVDSVAMETTPPVNTAWEGMEVLDRQDQLSSLLEANSAMMRKNVMVRDNLHKSIQTLIIYNLIQRHG